jgi:hypothetical protein
MNCPYPRHRTVLLMSGERMFDGIETFGLEPVEVLHSPLATHIRYHSAVTAAVCHPSHCQST